MQRTFAPEAGQASHDEARVRLEQVLWVQSESLENARAKRVNKDVGAPLAELA